MATTTKTGTYKPSTSTVATPGTSSAANTALQQSLVAKGAKIAVDGKYGPQTAAAFAQFGGSTTGSSPSNGGVTSATSTRAGYDALGNEIKTKTDSTKATYDTSALSSNMDAQNKLLKDRISSLETNYKANTAGIKTAYEEASNTQGDRQNKDYAGLSTNLITAGGGYLGFTGSHAGVLQNLTETHQQEKNALMAKRDAALQAATDSYDEKNFTLAQSQLKLAKDTEQEMYNRQQDYANQSLALAKEARSQKEFDVTMADKKVDAYATMSDAEFKNVTPEMLLESDNAYFPGFTEAKRAAIKKENDVKSEKDRVAIESDILDMRLKMEAGKKFQLNGVTYTGMKTKDAGSMTQADRDSLNKQKVQGWFTSATKIPGTDGIPFLSADGFATPEGWQTAYEYSNMDRRKFIQEFGYLLNSSEKDSDKNPTYANYGLVPAEVKLVNTLIPVNY